MDSKNWAGLKLNKQLLTAISEAGFTSPTKVQQQCIPLIMGGQQVIGIAQTGTGKTAAYLLPLLMKIKFAQGTAPRALVLAPTKELVVQIEAHAQMLAQHTDLRIVALFGGIGPKTQIEKIEAGVDILVATPGRFMDLYGRQVIEVRQLNTLVLDEADRMMDMGFIKQLRKIFEVIPAKRQNLLFSATFPKKVEHMVEEFIAFPKKVAVSPQATPAKPIKQVLYQIPNFKTKVNFLEKLLEKPSLKKVIVFVQAKGTADNLCKFIDRKHLGPVRAIHSNKGQNSRINAMNLFDSGTIRVLVSTDVAARGIDILKVSHVINFETPRKPEEYVHRIGRTGRANRTGVAITFANKIERCYVEKIEKLMKRKITLKPLPNDCEVTETPIEELKQMDREREAQRQWEAGELPVRKRKKRK